MSVNIEINKHVDAAKSDLIAWAMRKLMEETRSPGRAGAPSYPSATLEFIDAAQKVVPDVNERATRVNYHADMAVSNALNGD